MKLRVRVTPISSNDGLKSSFYRYYLLHVRINLGWIITIITIAVETRPFLKKSYRRLRKLGVWVERN